MQCLQGVFSSKLSHIAKQHDDVG